MTPPVFSALQTTLANWGIQLSTNVLFISALLIALCAGILIGRISQTWTSRRARERDLLRQQQLRITEQETHQHQLDQMRMAFSDLAQTALANNNQQFVALTQQHFKQLTDQASHEFKLNQLGIQHLIAPIKEALKATDSNLQALNQQRQSSDARLEEQIKQLAQGNLSLQTETRNLVTALRRPEVRGQWGELTLKRVVELSGLSRHCDFDEQPSTASETGSLRPDLVVHLPSQRKVIIDAKTPLNAYLEALESTSPTTQSDRLKQHAANVRQRVKELSQKQYWEAYAESAEFVLLFIPGEAFIAAALEHDPQLLEYALDKNVLLSGPSSLLGLLKTIAHGWQTHTLNQNTLEIRRAGDGLLQRLDVLERHLSKLGRHLDQSMDQYQKLTGSFNRSAKPAARKLSELGLGSLPADQDPPHETEHAHEPHDHT